MGISLIVAKSILHYAAAAATAIAGMLHLMLGPNNLGFNVNQGILFIVGGIAQVFWIIPIIRRWGKVWYGVGIAGTAVFMTLFLITRIQGNPITGRGGGANPTSIVVEIFEAIFIGLAAAIIVYESRKKTAGKTIEEQPSKKDRRKVPILVGIVVALVLSGVFVLPMAIPRPTGAPPGQGGGPPSAINQTGSQGQSVTQVDTSTIETCILTPSLIEIEGTPQQTEGPYFVDGMPNRTDIASDTLNGAVQDGIPLTLVINVYDSSDGSCIPISGTQVDIWHANFQGIYSGVQEQGTAGNNFLRGYQVTDDNGTVRFTTVYPGWYEGRAIHIHIKVRNFEGSQETFEWTSQFYLPNSANEQVHTQPPYSDHGPVNMVNEQDGIYAGGSTDGLVQSNTGGHLMLNVTDDEQGYSGTFNVVVDA
jgi:protocatechuate 3,4-dioxygenase beta subunit